MDMLHTGIDGYTTSRNGWISYIQEWMDMLHPGMDGYVMSRDGWICYVQKLMDILRSEIDGNAMSRTGWICYIQKKEGYATSKMDDMLYPEMGGYATTTKNVNNINDQHMLTETSQIRPASIKS